MIFLPRIRFESKCSWFVVSVWDYCLLHIFMDDLSSMWKICVAVHFLVMKDPIRGLDPLTVEYFIKTECLTYHTDLHQNVFMQLTAKTWKTINEGIISWNDHVLYIQVRLQNISMRSTKMVSQNELIASTLTLVFTCLFVIMHVI